MFWHERARQKMKQDGILQIDVANALHVKKAALSQWLCGARTPQLSIIVGIARFLDVSLDWLLAGEVLVKATTSADEIIERATGITA